MKKFDEITDEEAVNVAHLASGINNVNTTFKVVGRNFEMINLRMELPKNNGMGWKSIWTVQIYKNGDIQRAVDGVCVPIYDQLYLARTLVELKVAWANER